MVDDCKIARPLNALLPCIEPPGENDPPGKELRLCFRCRFVEHYVINDQLGIVRHVKLDIINTLVLGERPASPIGPASLSHIYRRGLPGALWQIRQGEEAMILLCQTKDLNSQPVRSFQPIAKSQSRVRAHRRTGHRIEDNGSVSFGRVSHFVVKVPAWRGAAGATVWN